MLITGLEMRNTLEEEEYQSILKGRRSKKPSRCGLRAKVMKGRWVRIKGGETVGVMHRCTLAALRMTVDQSVVYMYSGPGW